MCTRRLLLFVFFAMTLSISGSCGGGERFVVPTEVASYTAPDTDLIKLSVDGQELSVYKDQLVLLLKEGADASRLMLPILEAVGGRVVGQIASLGIFQLGVKAASESEFTALREKLMSMEGVEEVSFNVPVTFSGKVEDPACQSADDLDKLTDKKMQCAWKEIEYQSAVTILEKLKGSIKFSPVIVGVIDTGLEEGTGQFGGVKVVNLTLPGEKLRDLHGHGTMVSGIIAADNKDGGTNGIASRFLGKSLTLVAGNTGLKDSMRTLILLRLASKMQNASIVNCSFGLESKKAYAKWFVGYRKKYERVFKDAPQTLFVVAAGNEGLELTDTNFLPAGIELPNVLTVGGTEACKPRTRASYSNYGTKVRISAPSDVSVLNYVPTGGVASASSTPVLKSGTSFAAPIVTGIAVLLKSLRPGLTAAEIATLLKTKSYPSSSQFGGGRALMTVPILQVLYDLYPGAAVRDLIAPQKELPDTPFLVVNRICGGGVVEVEKYGSFDFSGEELNLSAWSDQGIQFILVKPDLMSFLVLLKSPTAKPGVKYNLPEPVTVNFTYSKEKVSVGGSGSSGSLFFERCEIVSRDENFRPLTLSVSIRASGNIEVLGEAPDYLPVQRAFELVLRANIALNSMREELSNHIDTVCTGQ